MDASDLLINPSNQETVPVPTEEELHELLKREAPEVKEDPNNFVLGSKIFPGTIQEFYDTFLS